MEGVKTSYEKTLEKLIELQDNVVTRDKESYDRRKLIYNQFVLDIVTRAGLEIEDLDKLKIIHVAGTKGKGSTCAFSESILRHHGFKTGSFTSPHLIEVNERIRINGLPIPKEEFSQYFWECYIPLLESKDRYDGLMPSSFFVMTLMAFKAFIREKVDVVIMEVGIGGQYCVTNMIKNPVISAVTSLGLDHTVILGDTLQDIAWHKSGIFKPNLPAATVPQRPEAQEVLMNRTKEIGAVLYTCSPLDLLENIQLGIQGNIQKYNASLAIQLCTTWLTDHLLSIDERQSKYMRMISEGNQLQQQNCSELSDQFIKGLTKCRWAGRCHKVKTDQMTFYLDAAHTEESIEACSDWFAIASKEQESAKTIRVLMFNITGGRQPMKLLKHLTKFQFDYAIFCPNIKISSEEKTLGMDKDELPVEMQQCIMNRDAWLTLIDNQPNAHISTNLQPFTTNEFNVKCNMNQVIENCAEKKFDGSFIHNEQKSNNIDNNKNNNNNINTNNDNNKNHNNNMNTNINNNNNHGDDKTNNNIDSKHNNANHNDFQTDNNINTKRTKSRKCETRVFESVQETLTWLNQISQCRNKSLVNGNSQLNDIIINNINSCDNCNLKNDKAHEVQILCTGSVYLVGSILHFIQPDACLKINE